MRKNRREKEGETDTAFIQIGIERRERKEVKKR